MSFNSIQDQMDRAHQQRQEQLEQKLAQQREAIGLAQLRDAMAQAGADGTREWAAQAHGRAGGFWNKANLTGREFALLASDPEAAASHTIYQISTTVEASNPRLGHVATLRHVLVKDGESPPEGAVRLGSVAHFAAQAAVAAKRRLRVWLQSERDRRAEAAERMNRGESR